MTIVVGQVIDDLNQLFLESNDRKYTAASKWAAEMLFNARSLNMQHPSSSTESHMDDMPTSIRFSKGDGIVRKMTQTLIECQEFQRASACSAGYDDIVLKFLHFYSLFLAGEKKKLDDTADAVDKHLQFDNPFLNRLQSQLENIYLTESSTMDGFLMHLYALVLKEQNLTDEAEKMFVQSLKLTPHFWPSWLELAKLIKNNEQLQAMDIPDHWMQRLFLGEAYIKLQMLQEALQVYDELSHFDFFKKSLYVKTQISLAYNNLQDPDSVVEIFKEIADVDEYRIDHVDTYSNCLFVKGMIQQLTSLAHRCFDVNKYCPETCCVVGNYYSMRGEHDKAILYFLRAVKLNPNNSGAYTLLGHEFMESKNTSAACLAYRKALRIDPKDFRAWYGLGQVYDILKMSNYAIHYYQVAHKVRPQDSRMIIALGDMYEKHQKLDEAKRCFYKAHCVGDVEGMALLRLGRLYEKINDHEQAASSYAMYLRQLKDQGVCDPEHQPSCLRFLADFNLNKDLDQAYEYAQMCLEFDSTKEEAKGILKRISQIRAASVRPASGMADDATV